MTRWILIVLHAVLGIAAIGAGQAFVRDPSGDPLGMSTEWLKRSPFPDYRFPGLFLTVVIGGLNLLSSVLLARQHARSPLVSFVTGVLLLAWVAIQTAIIGFRHWSQSIWWGTFTLIAVLAGRLLRQQA
jgi:uncharacterized membrane protein YqhA